MNYQRKIHSYHRVTSAVFGFTLIEVLVALLVTSIGLLGLIKMQSLAISNTQVAGSRSLIALQASSLVASMNGNRAYWASGLAPTVFSTQGATVKDALTGKLSMVVPNCAVAAAPACTPSQLAAYDLQQWAANMVQLVPSYAANFTCTDSAISQISCVITIVWSEKYVAVNRTTATGSATSGGTQTAAQSFSLYVAP
jgi:type IV pilus assembly protein PilV